MNKKIIILPIILLASCHKPTSSYFALEDKYYTISNKGLHDLNNIDEFIELEKSKESFGIYLYTPGCISCSNFKPILAEYLDTNNIQLYSISFSKLDDKSNTLKKNINYAPSVALFYQGELQVYLDAQKNEHIEYYESVEGFKSWFETYIDIKNTPN